MKMAKAKPLAFGRADVPGPHPTKRMPWRSQRPLSRLLVLFRLKRAKGDHATAMCCKNLFRPMLLPFTRVTYCHCRCRMLWA